MLENSRHTVQQKNRGNLETGRLMGLEQHLDPWKNEILQVKWKQMGPEEEKITSSSKVIEKKTCRKSQFRYTLENELNLGVCGAEGREDLWQKEQ